MRDFPQHLPFKVGYSTMRDGNMSYPLGVAPLVHASRKQFFEGQGLPGHRMVTFFTEHRDDITQMDHFPEGLDALKGERLAVTDAIVTRLRGTGVFLTFADCVPFIVYDQRQHLMAFAHIGWRSMEMRFTGKVLDHLLQAQGSRPQDLWVAVGPCIKAESYLYHDPVQARQEAWQPHLVPQPDGRMGIDLVGFCLAECGQRGILATQTFVEPMDTAADPQQFSHYAATEGGRPEKQGRLICYGYLE